MKMPGPAERYPVTLPDGSKHLGTVFLNQVVEHPDITIGDYTYASDFDPPETWAARLAPYLMPGAGQHISIGKYGQIASGVRFLAGSNHATDGFSTYPFPIFDEETIMEFTPDQRDTIVGHDVWIGNDAKILPGARVGNGVIIGAGAVIRGAVPDYSIVIGNPGVVTRTRFDAPIIARLLELAWWDWPAANVAAGRTALMAGDLVALADCAPE